MRRIALAAAVVAGCAVASWSQLYYESSGQTAVFTLAPGAKAAWNPSAAPVVSHTHHASPVRSLTVRTVDDHTVRFDLAGSTGDRLFLCDLHGRTTGRWAISRNEAMHIECRLPPGVYLARLTSKNGPGAVRSITVGR
jgi:hypothetical protein